MAAGAPPPQLAERESGSRARSAPPPSRRLLARVARRSLLGRLTRGDAGRARGLSRRRAGTATLRRLGGAGKGARERGRREADSAS